MTVAMAVDEALQQPLNFTGHRHLVSRLLLATLSGRPIRISQIRSSSTNPGLTRSETNFVRLLDAVTNGGQVQFSMTGTTLVYRPGLITGSAEGLGAHGGVIRHEIPRECSRRGVSWWLIPLCILAPFAKDKVNVILHGAKAMLNIGEPQASQDPAWPATLHTRPHAADRPRAVTPTRGLRFARTALTTACGQSRTRCWSCGRTSRLPTGPAWP